MLVLIKVGAPPEVVGRLSSLADDLKSNSDDVLEQPADPELDQFMVASYVYMYLAICLPAHV